MHSFGTNAWQKGWFRRFERKYIYDYRCYLSDPCNNCQFPDDFYLLEKTQTNEIREILP